MPVCGGVEAYNERSLHVKYRSQGVQTSFYESTPSAKGWKIPSPKGHQKIQGMREQISLMLQKNAITEITVGHTVAAYLHRQGISVIPYLGDWLIHNPSFITRVDYT